MLRAKISPSVLVIGGTGLIGRELVPFLRATGAEVSFTARPSRMHTHGGLPLNLANLPDNLAYLGNPTAVVFLGAVSGNKACEADPHLALKINVLAPRILLEHFLKRGAFCVFLSTSQVFSGAVTAPLETEVTSPVGQYGAQKAEAERYFVSKGDRAAVVRVTKVITSEFPLFTEWVAALRSGAPIQPHHNNYFAPVSVSVLLAVLRTVIEQRVWGVFHLSAARRISYLEAAQRIAERLSVRSDLVLPMYTPNPASGCMQLSTARLTELQLPALPEPLEAVDCWVENVTSQL